MGYDKIKGDKKPGLYLFLEDRFLEKPQGGGSKLSSERKHRQKKIFVKSQKEKDLVNMVELAEGFIFAVSVKAGYF